MSDIDIDGAAPAAHGTETGIAPVWLALAALAASFFHQLMLLMPAALVTLAPAAVFDNWLFWGAGVLGFVLMAWLAQPSRHGSTQHLSREQAPRLYARVDEMTDAIGAPRLHAIAIDNSINAGALEENRGVSLRPTRRVLILGLPLLRLLDTAAAEAVIAHELGHFSRRHGRLGHWLYRTRAAWTAWAASVREDEDDSSPWDRAGANFAELFLPWFSRASEAHSRRCEFEADALAAQWASPEALARALLLIEIAVMRQGDASTTLDLDALRASAEPPAQWTDEPVQELIARPPTPEEIAEALRHRQPQGSHPPHRQRMEALGVAGESLNLRPPAWEESAAAQWMGGVWPELCQAQGPWAGAAERLSWAMAHAALVGLDADSQPVLSELPELPESSDEAAWRRLHRRQAQAQAAIEHGRVQPCDLAPSQIEALRRAVSVNSTIVQAWLFDVPVEPSTVAVVLRIDPERMIAMKLSLEQVATTLALTMRLVLPAGRDWMPRFSYMTEGLPPELQARVDATPRLKG
ncbi:M48 family metallopeptidase [Roseateles sp. L2-2]|uniref:M48 family metallopeptidase n=1 Tax=Roseateles sp. L2-2 TaxID=3422597 RepID=UPI003D36FC67